jgi:hypothetical protein
MSLEHGVNLHFFRRGACEQAVHLTVRPIERQGGGKRDEEVVERMVSIFSDKCVSQSRPVFDQRDCLREGGK